MSGFLYRTLAISLYLKELGDLKTEMTGQNGGRCKNYTRSFKY